MTTKTKNSSPARKAYQRFKGKYSDCILLFRIEGYYEAFWEDAEIFSDVCNLPLFNRKKAGVSIPFIDIPLWEHKKYLRKMLRAGHKVAVCENINNCDVICIITSPQQS